MLMPGLLGLLVGKVRGGRIGYLATLSFRRLPMLYLALGLQFLANGGMMGKWNPCLMIVSYLLLIIFLASNLHLPGMYPIFLGVFLNALTIAANGGQMPVALEFLGVPLEPEMLDALKGKHTLLTAATRFPLLADIIPLKLVPISSYRLYSIGDIFQMMGIFLLLMGGMGCSRGEPGEKEAGTPPKGTLL